MRRGFGGHLRVYRRVIGLLLRRNRTVLLPVGTLAIIAVAPFPAVLPILAVATVLTETIATILATILTLDAVVAALIALIVHDIEIVGIIVEIVAGRAIALLLFFLPGAIVGQHAEIMVSELQIIFGVHPVARHLGIARHILVFFQKLRGVAPGAVVDPVAIVATAPASIVGASVVPAAIAAAGLPVVDQDVVLVFTEALFTGTSCSVVFPKHGHIGRVHGSAGQVGGDKRTNHAHCCQRRRTAAPS